MHNSVATLHAACLDGLGVLKGGPFSGFGALACALLAPGAVALLHGLSGGDSAGGRAPKKAHEAGIEHDRADHQEACDVAQLGSCEAEDEGPERHDTEAERDGEKLEAERGADGQQAEEAAQDGIAKKPAKPEGMTP